MLTFHDVMVFITNSIFILSHILLAWSILFHSSQFL